MKHRESFKAKEHIPHYSGLFLQAMQNPLVIYLTIAGNSFMFSGAYAFYYFEKGINPMVNRFWDAVYWSLCTVSTVGYGDIVPVTDPGRIVAVIMIVIGVVFFLSFMAIFATILTSIVAEQKKMN